MKSYESRIIEPIEIVTTFGPETEFEGELTFETSLRILGKFKGDIKTNGLLIIGEDAKVEADISAGSVIIGGYVKGNVEAKSKLEILSTGKIYGNVKTNKLRIADGVIFEGTCQMLKND